MTKKKKKDKAFTQGLKAVDQLIQLRRYVQARARNSRSACVIIMWQTGTQELQVMGQPV